MDRATRFLNDLRGMDARGEEGVSVALASGGVRDWRGLLFHGTCEEFDGGLRGGGYDGLVWTADCPAIAQSYIPKAGVTTIVSRPSSYELDQRVRPGRHCDWTRLAVRMSGIPLEACDVEYDDWGSARSWRVPKGWPTNREVVSFVEEMGYEASRHDCYEILMHDGEAMPADWRRQGRLFVVDGAGLRIKDIRRSTESDLTDVEYHDHAAFALAREQGWDGVAINDFAQTDDGNMGHMAYGLFPEVVERATCLSIPCVRSTMAEIRSGRTAAVDAWLEAAAVPDTAPVPGMAA